MQTQNKYEVLFTNGMSFEYKSYPDVIEAITIVANKMREFAVEVKEVNDSGDTIVIYQPEYSVKLIWTEITDMGKVEI